MADVSPFAGKVADPSRLVNVPQLVAAYYTERPDPSVPAQRVSFGTSGHRGSSFDALVQRVARAGHHPGDLPLSSAAGHRRTAVPRHRHARALRAGAAGARSKCSPPTAWRCMISRQRRVHADAGRLARDPHLQPRAHQRAGRRHRDHAVAQSARGRRLQVQPAARRARGFGRSPASSSARRTTARRRPDRREARPLRAGAARVDDPPPRFSQRLRRRPRTRCSIST